jgi:hypothetical protein
LNQQLLLKKANSMPNERQTPRGAITYALWSKYEMQLPESPWRMAGFIVEHLIEEGYIKGDE